MQISHTFSARIGKILAAEAKGASYLERVRGMFLAVVVCAKGA